MSIGEIESISEDESSPAELSEDEDRVSELLDKEKGLDDGVDLDLDEEEEEVEVHSSGKKAPRGRRKAKGAAKVKGVKKKQYVKLGTFECYPPGPHPLSSIIHAIYSSLS